MISVSDFFTGTRCRSEMYFRYFSGPSPHVTECNDRSLPL